MDDQRFLHQLAHAHVGAEAGEWILEDGLGALAEGQQGIALELAQVHALEDDAPRRDGTQVQRGAPERGLAAARFAHHGHGLALGEVEVDLADGADGRVPKNEVRT